MRRIVALFLLVLCGSSANAAQLSLTFKSSDGRGVADVVATFKPSSGVAPGWRWSGPREMAQEHIAFLPHILLTAVGSEVTFPNHDHVRHHVYSFSPAKRFELKLYGQEQSRTVLFDKPGVVALGCNIHDRMSGFIIVLDTPYAGKSDAAGHLFLDGLPEGPGALTLWQERLKAPQNQITQPITVKGAAQQTITLDVKPPPPPMAGMDMGER